MADAPKILGTDSLRQAYPKLNSAIDNSNAALSTSKNAETKANSAVSTALQAESKANNVQVQFNQVVINGDSSVEAAQARVNADGTTFATLKERLDTTDGELSAVPIKQLTQETTAGRSWSTSTNELSHLLNGESVVFRTAPKGVKRRLVVLGSSTSEGFYATAGNSWFDKLKADLPDWECALRGLSGDNTTAGINRFHADVVPYNPDVCLIAFTIGNEGVANTKTLEENEAAIEQFKTNILTLGLMCRQNGITPIVIDQFPTKRYTSDIYRLAAELNKAIETAGFITINFKGAVDAVLSSGVPLNLAMYDDIHPNDTGHHAMYRAINRSLFKYAAVNRTASLIRSQGGALKTPDALTDTEKPISFTPKVPLESFTFFFRLKATQAVVAQKTWAGIGLDLRISNQNDATHTLDLRGGGMSAPIISSVGLDDLKEHSLCVTFSKVSKSVKFYVDGKLVGSDTSPDLAVPEITLAGRVGGVIGNNATFKDFAVYRARLSDEQIYDLHNGFYTTSSLDVFAPMNDAPNLNARLTNLAPTDEIVRINTASLTRA